MTRVDGVLELTQGMASRNAATDSTGHGRGRVPANPAMGGSRAPGTADAAPARQEVNARRGDHDADVRTDKSKVASMKAVAAHPTPVAGRSPGTEDAVRQSHGSDYGAPGSAMTPPAQHPHSVAAVVGSGGKETEVQV